MRNKNRLLKRFVSTFLVAILCHFKSENSAYFRGSGKYFVAKGFFFHNSTVFEYSVGKISFLTCSVLSLQIVCALDYNFFMPKTYLIRHFDIFSVYFIKIKKNSIFLPNEPTKEAYFKS